MIGNKIFFIIFFFAYCFCKEKDSVDIYYDNGLSAYNKGQYDLAIQELNYILSLDFESPELYYNLGNAFYRRGEVGGQFGLTKAVYHYLHLILMQSII